MADALSSIARFLAKDVSRAFAFICDRQPVVLDPGCRWQWLASELSGCFHGRVSSMGYRSLCRGLTLKEEEICQRPPDYVA